MDKDIVKTTFQKYVNATESSLKNVQEAVKYDQGLKPAIDRHVQTGIALVAALEQRGFQKTPGYLPLPLWLKTSVDFRQWAATMASDGFAYVINSQSTLLEHVRETDRALHPVLAQYLEGVKEIHLYCKERLVNG